MESLANKLSGSQTPLSCPCQVRKGRSSEGLGKKEHRCQASWPEAALQEGCRRVKRCKLSLGAQGSNSPPAVESSGSLLSCCLLAPDTNSPIFGSPERSPNGCPDHLPTPPSWGNVRVASWTCSRAHPQQGFTQWEPHWVEQNPTGHEQRPSSLASELPFPSQPLSLLSCVPMTLPLQKFHSSLIGGWWAWADSRFSTVCVCQGSLAGAGESELRLRERRRH